MLEAVNSVLQTSPLTKATAERVSTAESYASNPDKVQKVAQAPYVSPYIHVDLTFDTAVLQIRDSDTGDVLTQFPSESRLAERTRQEKALLAAENAAPRKQAEVSQGGEAKVAAPESSSHSIPVPSQQLAAFESASQTASQSANVSGGDVTMFA